MTVGAAIRLAVPRGCPVLGGQRRCRRPWRAPWRSRCTSTPGPWSWSTSPRRSGMSLRGTFIALAANVAPLRRLWEVQLKSAGGLCLVALRASCNQSVLVVAVHLLLSSLAVRAHLLALVFLIRIPLKKSLMAFATLGMSSTRICLVFFLPSRRCCCPFSLLRRRVMWVSFTTRSSVRAHAPHSPLQKKT